MGILYEKVHISGLKSHVFAAHTTFIGCRSRPISLYNSTSNASSGPLKYGYNRSKDSLPVS